MADRLTSPLTPAFTTRNNEGKPFVRPVLQATSPTGEGVFGGQSFIKVFPYAEGVQGASFWLRIYAWHQVTGADNPVPPQRGTGYHPSLLCELYCVVDDNPGYDGGAIGIHENMCWGIWATNGTVSYIQNPGYGLAAWAVIPLMGCNLFQFDAMDARMSANTLHCSPNALWAGMTP